MIEVIAAIAIAVAVVTVVVLGVLCAKFIKAFWNE